MSDAHCVSIPQTGSVTHTLMTSSDTRSVWCSGMAAERDVNRRAPEGVIVRTTDTFDELYQAFDNGQLDAIAEAEYYSLDGEIIPSHGDEIILIDHHDLTPGQRGRICFLSYTMEVETCSPR